MKGKLTPVYGITGRITQIIPFRASLTISNSISAELSADILITAKLDSSDSIRADISQEIDAFDYTGDYTVTPRSTEQQVNTKFKTLSRNITVEKIPYYETSNISGTTVYIGE